MGSEDRLKISDFNYHLPPALIAQTPLPERDQSRLLVLNRSSNRIEHSQFKELVHHFKPGDVLVINDSRVIPARLEGRKIDTGGRVEILLLEEIDNGRWRAIVGGRRLLKGSKIRLVPQREMDTEIVAEVTRVRDGPLREVKFSHPVEEVLNNIGQTPLPPYIQQALEDANRYQTIYARFPGSTAAPTAGLHFTPETLLSLRELGVIIENVTLHIGLDTFKPVTAEFVDDHPIHRERVSISTDTARRINEAKLAGGKIWAAGTTSVRALETAALRSAGVDGPLSAVSALEISEQTLEACAWRPVVAIDEYTDLYIYPGYQFRAVNAMLTNFHLPQSTLILLVSAFAGSDLIADAYKEAIDRRYRFYSFGDAMLIM